MARYGSSYGNPYAQPHVSRPRWPWVFGTVVLLAIFASSGLLVADRLDPNNSPLGQLAQRVTQTPDASHPPPTATTEPTEVPTEAPTPTAVDTQAPMRTVENWIALWSTGDYNAMYDMASKEVQASTSRDAFASRYAQISEEAGINSVSGKVVGNPTLDGDVTVDMTIESNLVGTITDRNVIPVVKEDDSWRVAWTPSLIFSQLGPTECINFTGESTTRGRILDRHGVVLAEDTPVARIGVIPADVSDQQAMAEALSPIVGMSANDILNTITRDGWDPSWLVPVKDLPGEPNTDLINQVQAIPGVVIQAAVARYYPQGALTAHITGWVSEATAEDVDNDTTGSVHSGEMVGRSGLEYGANELLAGKPGGALNVIDCQNREVKEEIARSKGTPPQDLYLTIDLELQKQVDAALTAEESPDKSDGLRSAAVYIDPRTGAVLAMVSHPSFDPNDALNNTYTEQERQMINDETLSPQTNRATFARYPTGSIFKSITYAAAMHYLNYTGDTPINCPQTFTIGNQSWSDWVVENGLSAQGELTLHSGLVRSCNTVFYQLGAALDRQDPNALPDMAKAFGLGSPTGIEYFPEIGGSVPSPEWKMDNVGDGWSTGDAVLLAIGQGYLTATPLQMANAYASIANGGDVLQPYIVDRSQAPDGTITQVGKRTVMRHLPLSDAQVADLQSALAEQPHNDQNVGSAKVFNDFDWPISGKTGTAQVESNEKPHAWFAAYGGSDGEATITSVTLVENVGEGVTYAAPATKKVFVWYSTHEAEVDATDVSKPGSDPPIPKATP